MIDDALVAAQVDAAAALLGMPLDAEWRAAVIATMARLAAFADDVAAVRLDDQLPLREEPQP
jgi:hypothetical protein